ncbi:bifunctional 4-hydroxy-2-oxoglutarate aldolase/2-dehydro-3-deoxy-phosphogluconate aldolase [Spirosoma agri]|uniref:Bifunctional 4-hydroxy-2-oxoglutarate aldolase/2-dehydro-3-deoxy-phosphogluconate aldolase n=1 Tax=Spirosoma agri TaxID=1987381 RepID=A0A6M0IP42_9BACT|nr:bifunctional 4-hydroxy-2-oxoglutarate aldolase/2-dehydro-3-deoxy-phosphogluconate aldolase [Spirosoma agri]NEU70099.1 bifunctional 4-hydroxy-2-oxoglutarate aldolase/2-dehydro-3-deoxy-phosphogluconate aldolase [Spirosoma agri]
MSFSITHLLTILRAAPLVPVFYHADPDRTRQTIQACYEGRLRVFEFTNRGADALATFTQVVPFVRQQCPEMALGIGTILTPDEADAFMDAGADFVVQPVITPTVGDRCHARNIPWIPAGTTLNELYQATGLGAQLLKVFPANVVGPDFIKAIRGPMPGLKLMVTGGVEPTVESVRPWLAAGATALGLGSQLFAGDSLQPDQLRLRITDLLAQLTPYLPTTVCINL